MNEKTKQILRYVACGVGGLALGIGLLGGLAMCASSGNRSTTESVNKILTKKNAVIDTGSTGGNYTGYQFTLDVDMPSVEKAYQYSIYSLDVSTYTPTLVESQSGTFSTNTRSALVNLKNSAYSAGRALADNNDYRNTRLFLLLASYSYPYGGSEGATYYPILYTTFIEPSFTNYVSGVTNVQTAFVTDDLGYYWNAIGWDTNSYAQQGIQQGTQYFVTNQKVDYYLYRTQSGNVPETLTFQDVASYYKTIGYGDGYEQGYTDGDNVGYWAGYNEGIGTASSFTDITANLNAVYDLTPMGVGTATWQNLHGLTDVKIYSLLQFFDNEQDTWDAYIVDGVASDQPTGTRTMYVDVAQLSSLDSQTIGRAIYNNASTISLQEVSTAHFEFAQIRNVSNRSLSLKLLLLTGWTNDNTAYQAGYQAGLKDGFEGTNTNNVFSLFTSAFNAVGGFFNLKVFGFLPLYWFFLTPLFVALISLLLRMVKH